MQKYTRTKSNLNKSRANSTLYDLEMPSKQLNPSKIPFSGKYRPASAKVWTIPSLIPVFSLATFVSFNILYVTWLIE